MKETLIILAMAALSIYAWITKRQLDSARHSKLDETIKNLKKGLDGQKKETKNAKDLYYTIRNRFFKRDN